MNPDELIAERPAPQPPTQNGHQTAARRVTIDPNRIGRTGHRLMGGIDALEAWIVSLHRIAENVRKGPEDRTPEEIEAKREIAEKAASTIEGVAQAMALNVEQLKQKLMQIGKERGAVTIGGLILPGNNASVGGEPIETNA